MRDTWNNTAKQNWAAATGQALWTPEKEAALCDAIADGASFPQAAAVAGVTISAAKSRFHRIRLKYGVQAQ